MAQTRTTSPIFSEMREFAGFEAHEQAFITRSLDVGLRRGDAFEAWSGEERGPDAIRSQYLAYRDLANLRVSIPDPDRLQGVDIFIGRLVRVSAQDIAQEKLDSFSSYRFLYERLLGAAVRPFLPAAFCAAAALPQIRPERRRLLLQSLSEAAATAPGWSMREPGFVPERVEAEAA